jgi:hypothetical protein
MDPDADPDPAFFVTDLQETNKKPFFIQFFCLLLFEITFSFFKDKKTKMRIWIRNTVHCPIGYVPEVAIFGSMQDNFYIYFKHSLALYAASNLKCQPPPPPPPVLLKFELVPTPLPRIKTNKMSTILIINFSGIMPNLPMKQSFAIKVRWAVGLLKA